MLPTVLNQSRCTWCSRPAVSRLEDREYAEGPESQRRRREQKLAERLRQDRLHRAVQPLLLAVERQGRIAEQAPHQAQGNPFGDLSGSAQSRDTLARYSGHRGSVDLLSKTFSSPLDHVRRADADGDQPSDHDDQLSGGPRKHS